MANSVTTQTLIDGPRNLVVKITGILDTSNLGNTLIVTPATTFKVTGSDGNNPPLARLDHIDYSIADGLELILSWGNGAGPITPILPLAGRGRMSFVDFEGLRNNAVGTDGSVWLSSTGYSSGTSVFSLVLEMVKEGLLYSGGAR
jgi:hypothetical protein